MKTCIKSLTCKGIFDRVLEVNEEMKMFATTTIHPSHPPIRGGRSGSA